MTHTLTFNHRAAPLTPDEASALDRLEVELNRATTLGESWRVRAALVAGTALVLDAQGEQECRII